MDKNMENQIITEGISGFQELDLSYILGKPYYVPYIPIMVT